MASATSKTAFVTGASSGIGAEFALQLGGRGYNLVLTSRRADRLEKHADFIRNKHNVNVKVHPADLSKIQDIEQLVPIIANTSDLDLLVNDAGFGTTGRFYKVDPTKELAMMNVHMIAPVMFCRAAIPGMLARNQGAIINVSSLTGLIPIRNVVYQSTKAFLINFSYALEREIKGSQVRIQALCPGFVYTGFHDTPEYTHFSRKSVPGFLWMTSEQVVSASLKALEGHQLICIPGLIYQLAGALARNSLSAGFIRLAAQIALRGRRTFINT